MDVTCERCQTEYEFDETLISDRGTTVKCTHCGHLFKIFRTGSGPHELPGGGARVWTLRRQSGETLTFDRLATLQQWILDGRVTKKDEISRTGEVWKRLGAIAELATFFAATTGLDGAATEQYQSLDDAPTQDSGREPTHKGLPPEPPPRAPEKARPDRPRAAKATMLGVAPDAAQAPGVVPLSAPPVKQAAAGGGAVIGRAASPTLETAQTLRSRPEGTSAAAPETASAAAVPARAAPPPRPEPGAALTPAPPVRPTQRAAPTPAPPVRPADPPRPRIATPRGMAPPRPSPATREPTPPPAKRAAAPAPARAPTPYEISAAPRDSFDPSVMPAVAIVEPSGDVGSVRPSMGPQPAWATAGPSLGHVPEDAGHERPRESEAPAGRKSNRTIGIVLSIGILAIVLGGVVVLAGPGLARFFGGAFSAPPPPPPHEDRAGTLVAEGRQAMLADRDADLSRAVTQFQQALGVSADDARALAGLGEALALQAQALHDEADDLEEKAHRLRSAEETDPNVARAELQARAKVLRESAATKISDAKGFAERATKAAPDAHRALADALRLAGDLPAARASLARALARDASSAENRYASAILALETAETKPQARVDLREAILANPRLVRAILRLARLDALEGDVASARAGAQRALEVQPDHPRAQALLAAIDAGDPPVVPVEIAVGPDAVSPDGGTTTSQPDGGAARTPPGPGPSEPQGGSSPPAGRTPEWYVGEGERMQRNGQAEQARRMFEQALSLQPGRSEALAGLGFVLLSLGDARGAMTQFRRLLDSNPSYAAGYYGMGQAAQRLGQTSVAAQNYRRFLESSSSGPRADAARRFLDSMSGGGTDNPPPDQGGPPPDQGGPPPDQGGPPPDQGGPPPDQGGPPPNAGGSLPAPRNMAPGTVPPSDRPAVDSEPPGLPPVTDP